MAAEHDQKKVVHAQIFPYVCTIILPVRCYASCQELFQNTRRVLVSKGAEIAFTNEQQFVFSTSNYTKYTISLARVVSMPGSRFIYLTLSRYIFVSYSSSIRTSKKFPSSLHFLLD